MPLVTDAYTPEAPRRTAISTLALTNGSLQVQSEERGLTRAQALSQRKRLLKAPTLAELDSSDSEVCVKPASRLGFRVYSHAVLI